VSTPRVLLDVPLPDFLATELAPHCEFRPWSLLETGSVAELADIRAVYTYGHPNVDGAILDRLEGVLVVSNFGVGVDHIHVADADERGIPVGNTPGAVDGATADMAMALLLGAARNLVVGDRFARSPDFTSYDPSHLPGWEVHGSTLGIIGMGRVGTQVARRARGFDMRVLYHNRRRREDTEAELGVEYADLDRLLRESHFVVLCVPLTAETRKMISEKELRTMRGDGILVNVARGGVVDHDALYRALSEHWIGVAAIDVTEPEPLPRDHPLLRVENLVIAPHLGSATIRTRKRMGDMARANLLAGLAGRELPNRVRTAK
jgi:glyoxylate reductase